jgi:hypothetical protein
MALVSAAHHEETPVAAAIHVEGRWANEEKRLLSGDHRRRRLRGAPLLRLARGGVRETDARTSAAHLPTSNWPAAP